MRKQYNFKDYIKACILASGQIVPDKIHVWYFISLYLPYITFKYLFRKPLP